MEILPNIFDYFTELIKIEKAFLARKPI